jgi:hypothetical protein
MKHPAVLLAGRVVSISAVFRHDGRVQEALELFPQMSAEVLAGSPIEAHYERLSPGPARAVPTASSSGRTAGAVRGAVAWFT